MGRIENLYNKNFKKKSQFKIKKNWRLSLDLSNKTVNEKKKIFVNLKGLFIRNFCPRNFIPKV